MEEAAAGGRRGQPKREKSESKRKKQLNQLLAHTAAIDDCLFSMKGIRMYYNSISQQSKIQIKLLLFGKVDEELKDWWLQLAQQTKSNSIFSL